MTYEALRKKVKELESRAPKGYVLLDREGQEVLVSELEPLEWFNESLRLLNDPMRADETQELRETLRRSVRSKGGDKIFELAAVLYAGPHPCSENPVVEKVETA